VVSDGPRGPGRYQVVIQACTQRQGAVAYCYRAVRTPELARRQLLTLLLVCVVTCVTPDNPEGLPVRLSRPVTRRPRPAGPSECHKTCPICLVSETPGSEGMVAPHV
jgi:hypothetical protein